MKKRLELEVIVKKFGYKIIAVTESWTTPEINDCELSLEGFVLFRKDRNEIKHGKGGGALLYVSNDIKCVAIDKLNHLKCESLWVELQEHTGASLTLAVCYRSQSAAYSEIREMFAAIGQASKGRCLIVGDFNYPTKVINWDVLEGNNKDEEEFLDVLQDNFLLQHVDGPRDGNII